MDRSRHRWPDVSISRAVPFNPIQKPGDVPTITQWANFHHWNRGKPSKWMGKIMENPIKNGMIWGKNPYFLGWHPNGMGSKKVRSKQTPSVSHQGIHAGRLTLNLQTTHLERNMIFQTPMIIWLVVSTHLKNISQNGNLPQVGMKIKHIWNHHLVMFHVNLQGFCSSTFFFSCRCLMNIAPLPEVFTRKMQPHKLGWRLPRCLESH